MRRIGQCTTCGCSCGAVRMPWSSSSGRRPLGGRPLRCGGLTSSGQQCATDELPPHRSWCNISAVTCLWLFVKGPPACRGLSTMAAGCHARAGCSDGGGKGRR